MAKSKSLRELLGATPERRRKFLGTLIGVALAFAVLGVFWIIFQVRAFDFDSAPRCSATPGPGCLVAQSGKVESKDSSSDGKKLTAWLTVTGFGQVTLEHADGVWAQAHVGDTVTLLSWRGTVVEVQDGTALSATPFDPDVPAQRFLGLFALVSGMLVAMLLANAVRRSAGAGLIAGSGGIYALWALVTGYACGLVLLIAPRPAWALIPIPISAVAAVMIAVEFMIRRPRSAARDADEAQSGNAHVHF